MQVIFGDASLYAGIGYILGGSCVDTGQKWNSAPSQIVTDNATGRQINGKALYKHNH